MTLLLAIAVSKPDGTMYRMAAEWSFHSFAAWIVGLTRLL